MRESLIDERYIKIIVELSQTSCRMGIYISMYNKIHPFGSASFRLLVIYSKTESLQ
jgi:hypothetical protein